jgi:signal transduction histidine kinase
MARFTHALHRRFKQNSFSPSWLPSHWYSLALGYGCALLSQVLLLVLSLAFRQVFLSLPFPDVLVICIAGCLALTWGVGPALLSLAWGEALLELVIFPATYPGPGKYSPQPACVVVFLFIGIAVIGLASQMMQSHRRALTMNQRMIGFLNDASHELRTPLASLTISVRLAQRQVTTIVAHGDIAPDTLQGLHRVEELLTVAAEQTTLQGHLVNSMLDAVRTPANGITIDAIWEKDASSRNAFVREHRRRMTAIGNERIDYEQAASR